MVTLEARTRWSSTAAGWSSLWIRCSPLARICRSSTRARVLPCSPSDETHDHDAYAHDEHDELYNAHVWLDPSRAIKQVQNIADGLAEGPTRSTRRHTKRTRRGCIERLTTLDDER